MIGCGRPHLPLLAQLLFLALDLGLLLLTLDLGQGLAGINQTVIARPAMVGCGLQPLISVTRSS